MAADNLEGVEVDRLINELKAPAPKRVAAPVPNPTPVIPPAPATSPPAATVTASAGAAAQPMYRGPLTPLQLRPMREFSLFTRIQTLVLKRVHELEVDRGAVVVRTCVGLGVSLSAAMPFWPYPKGCGWWLLLYLFAVCTVIVAGSWGAKLTWDAHLGITHSVAIAVVMWGITLAVHETLIRIGYAKVEATWLCP
jgi:hypothetical protein